jgi:hypothetical protein
MIPLRNQFVEALFMLRRFVFAAAGAALVLSGCAHNGASAPEPVLPQAQGVSQPQGVLRQQSRMQAQTSASYRHGVVPMLNSPGVHFSEPISANDLHFRGASIDGVGVTTGKPKIYIVFWGSQWGTESVNGSGYDTFSGDPKSLAPDVQAFFKGLGTGTERWSGVMTQYCQNITTGLTTCPTTAPHVGYPTGGALAGVWEDTSATAPAQATAHQIAQEAANAALHFGNTTQSLNRHVQYDIISPTGTNPDNYEGNGFCAWHDYTKDSTLDGGGGVSGPAVAFSNMPYVPDAGANCGAGFVNPGNVLDGVTIVNGHEYAETITDQFPVSGWTANDGEEDGDLCAWLTTGAGRTQDITLTTGTFAVQGTWSNLANKGNGGCAIKNAIVR